MHTVMVGLLAVFALAPTSVLDKVCSNELDPGVPGERDSFSVQCLKDTEEYASVQCSTSNTGEAVSCSFSASDPGDFCAVSVSCNVYFLGEQDQILDQVFVEEGATGSIERTGLWAKTRVECGCLEWW